MKQPARQDKADTAPRCSRQTAIHALRQMRVESMPAAVIEILKLACVGLPAPRATFWRLVADAQQLRLFAEADARTGSINNRARIAVEPALREALDSAASRCFDREALPLLAEALHTGTRTQTLVVQPVYLFDVALGLLCLELPHTDETPGDADEAFLQLLAARIEAAYLAEPLLARRRDDTPPAEYALRQSYLALDDDSLRDLFYLAPTAMLLSDADEARALAFNQHALTLFGIAEQSNADVLTTDFWEDAEERRRFVNQVIRNGHARDWRSRLRKTDGRVFWAQVSATLIDYQGRRALISSIADISDTVAAEEMLNRTQKTLMTLLEASPYPLIVTRLDTGVIRFCNRKAADMFETPLSGLLGHTAPEFYVNPTDRSYFVEKLRSNNQVEGFVAKLKTSGGQPFWAMLSARTLELNGEPVFMVAFADVTKQKHKEEELEHLAFRDGLTGAYNRRYFLEAAHVELARADRNARLPVLALIDIDHFKRLNDNCGHETGDFVLKEFVRVVQGMLRKSDLLARYGGEEFAILFPETRAEDAFAIVERIRQTVAGHGFTHGEQSLGITLSAGVASGLQHYGKLMQAADEALYDAKRKGRNRVEQAEKPATE